MSAGPAEQQGEQRDQAEASGGAARPAADPQRLQRLGSNATRDVAVAADAADAAARGVAGADTAADKWVAITKEDKHFQQELSMIRQQWPGFGEQHVPKLLGVLVGVSTSNRDRRRYVVAAPLQQKQKFVTVSALKQHLEQQAGHKQQRSATVDVAVQPAASKQMPPQHMPSRQHGSVTTGPQRAAGKGRHVVVRSVGGVAQTTGIGGSQSLSAHTPGLRVVQQQQQQPRSQQSLTHAAPIQAARDVGQHTLSGVATTVMPGPPLRHAASLATSASASTRDVRPGDDGWQGLMDAVRKKWEGFNAQHEAGIEFVRITRRGGGQHAGQAYKSYKLKGFKGLCRSVSDIQVALQEGTANTTASSSHGGASPPQPVVGAASTQSVANHALHITTSSSVRSDSGVACGGKRALLGADTRSEALPKRLKAGVDVGATGRIECAVQAQGQGVFSARTSIRAHDIPVRPPKHLLRRLGLPMSFADRYVVSGGVVTHANGLSHKPSRKNVVAPVAQSENPFTHSVADNTLCAAEASFVYAGGMYPFSNIARCSADMATQQAITQCTPCPSVCMSVSCESESPGIADNNDTECGLHYVAATIAGAGGGDFDAVVSTPVSDEHKAQSRASLQPSNDGVSQVHGCTVLEHAKLVQELARMTQERDAALILAQQLRTELLKGNRLLGLLALSPDAFDV